jgi:hypothetical protein
MLVRLALYQFSHASRPKVLINPKIPEIISYILSDHNVEKTEIHSKRNCIINTKHMEIKQHMFE